MEQLHLLNLKIRNHKAIEGFAIELDGAPLIVAGKTGTGKSSAVAALWTALEKCVNPLREGSKKGYVACELGPKGGAPTLWISRTFTKKGDKPEILFTSEDGSKEKMPVRTAQELVSALSVNPHQIANMKPTARVNALLRAAGIGEKLEELDAAIEQWKQDRLTARRTAESLNPGPTPDKVAKVDISALSGKLEAIREHNRQIAGKQEKLADVVATGQRLRNDVAETEQEIERLTQKLEQQKVDLETRVSEYKRLKSETDETPEDTSPIEQQLAEAQETNEQAALWESWDRQNAQHEAVLEQWTEADNRTKELSDDRKNLLESAAFPLSGISVEDGDIIYNGKNIDSLGESERKLVFCALAINDIKQHPIQCVRIDDLEVMGRDDQDKMVKMFSDNGIQPLMVRVDRDDEIEDGEIRLSDCPAKDA